MGERAAVVSKYAARTQTTVDSSRNEVIRLLRRYGCTDHRLSESSKSLGIEFILSGLPIRVDITYPNFSDYGSNAAYQQEIRRLWRVLILVIKSKMELIDEGVESVEKAFLPYLILPDGQTVSEHSIQGIREQVIAGHQQRVRALPERT